MNKKGYLSSTLIAIFFIFLGFGLLAPDAALAIGVSGVARSVDAAGEGQNTVTLSINDTMPSVVGIRETLPEGCALVSCTLPEGQYQVSGNGASFVAINTTSFSYVVTGLGSRGVSGQWTDMLSTGQGAVNEKEAAGTGTGGAGGSGANSQAGARATPGFTAVLVIISISVWALLIAGRDR